MNQAVRILILNSCINGGGAGRSLIAYLDQLDERVQAIVAMPGPGVIRHRLKHTSQVIYVPEFVERITRSPFVWPEKFGMPWAHLPICCLLLPIAMIKLAKLARKLKPDVIYCNHMLAKPIGAVIGTLARVPVVFHARNVHAHWIGRRFYSWLGARPIVKRIICNSNASAAAYRVRSENKVTIVPNAIDVDDFSRNKIKPRLRSEFNIASDVTIIGYLGRILPKKGICWLIQSFYELQKRHPHTVLALVGDNDGGLHFDARARYESMAKALGIRDKVAFTGFKSDIRPYLADFDLLAFPSIEPESFGRVLLEAMALGIPPITSAHGGAIEVVENREQGIWVDSNDVKGLSRAMEELVVNRHMRARYGASGMERVRKNYDSKVVASRISSIFVQVARGDSNRYYGYQHRIAS